MKFNKKDSVADAVQSILHQEEKQEDNLSAKLIKTVAGDKPEETPARKSIEAHGGPVPQPKVGVTKYHKESVTLKGFKTRYEEHSIFEQMVNEVLSKDASAGQWIHDFVHSDNPKFAGKSKAERKKQALAAYYAKQRNEEVESESLIESIEMINEVSVGAKIKAYAHHSAAAFDHGDMGNDAESDHHQARADKIHAHILKHHGTEAAHHAEKAASAAIFGNGKSKSHGDSLSGGLRGMHSKSVTKSGKIPKNTQSAMKNSAKGSYGDRVVGPKGHLPEEVEQVEEGLGDTLKKAAKKVGEVLGGPDDEGHKKDLQKKMGIPQTGKPGHAKQNEEVESIDEKLNTKKKTMDTLAGRVEVPADTHNQHSDTKVELNSEGWDDMLKDVKSKKGPQPSGGSGVKQGTRYGGGKQKDPSDDSRYDAGPKPVESLSGKNTPKSKVLNNHSIKESKRPESDDVPFAPPYNTSSGTEVVDKSGAQHTPMSRAKHLARLAMGRVKKDLGKKGK